MPEPVSLLTIPGEIRNQIYSYLLLLPAPASHRVLGDPPLHSAILSTCSKLHREAIQILYGSNTFLAHPSLLSDLPQLRLYYSTISSPALISLITKYHMRIRLDNDPNFTQEKAAKAFTGMEELTLEVFQAQYGSSGYRVLKLFEGIRGVGIARVYGSVTIFPEYARWLEHTMMADVGVGRSYETQDNDETSDDMVREYDMWIDGGR